MECSGRLGIHMTDKRRGWTPSDRDRILVVDDDLGTRETMTYGLSLYGYAVQAVGSGAEARAVCRRERVDFALVDLRLPDMTGIEFLESIDSPARPAFALMSGWLSVAVAVRATRLGALEVFEKPVALDDIVAMLSAELAPSALSPVVDADDARPACSAMRPVAERWAHFVATATELSEDPRTIGQWAKAVGVSYSSLCETCRLLRIRPHDARDLARLLRAVHLGTREQCPPDALLDISDRRTLALLLRRAGLASLSELQQCSLHDLLAKQLFVSASNDGLSALRARIGGAADV